MEKQTVLIVDDKTSDVELLTEILSGADYSVLLASSSNEAQDILHDNAETLSAVILSGDIPGTGSYGVLNFMRKNDKLKNIPVITVDGVSAALAFSLGAQDHMVKPYRAQVVLHRLAHVISLNKAQNAAERVQRDELTGLLNRDAFLTETAKILKNNPDKRYDLICIDIEHFSLIKDTYGMETGDSLLCHIANILDSADNVKAASRFIKDTYYLLTDYKDTYSEEECERFYRQLNNFPISMEIKPRSGVYHIEDASVPVETMCDMAKLAANKIRGKAGKWYYIYDDALRQEMMQELQLTHSVRNAFDEGQFKVYYQLKYELATGKVAGAEALVRWDHPENGLTAPGAFIPLLEKNGLITKLDMFVWEKVCKDMRSRADRGLELIPVSVNVSRLDIYLSNLADILLGLVNKYRVPIDKFHLEITESAYTKDTAQLLSVLTHLHNIGFILEMDDFGSGYSSLNTLSEMPFDILKMDMQFVKNSSNNNFGRSITYFIVSLARWMNVAVIAEGVETEEQVAMLRSMDCDYAQGYYFARPVPLNECEELINRSETVEMRREAATGSLVYKTPEEIPSDNRGVMLLVDDIPANRAVLADIFKDRFIIAEADNGKTALEYLNGNPNVDIIVLDLLMPIMDGFQFLERRYADHRLSSIPTVVISQDNGSNNEERVLALGADDFITKPFSREIVSRRIRNVMGYHGLKKLEGKEG